MKVSILGNGLTSLTLAKILINRGITVDIYSKEKIKNYNKVQTLGISKTNIDFFNENILDIRKLLWKINKIEIYNENLLDMKILNFENNSENLFFIIKNFELYKSLYKDLQKSKLVKFKKEFKYDNLFKIKYDLIFNCEKNHSITKKFFYKSIGKDYDSLAYITSFTHKRVLNNHKAVQVFTKRGPLAYLPISAKETSVVISLRGKKDVNLENLISFHNKKYDIFKINKILSFKLKSFNLRSYYYKNIIAFGDLLHKIHPLAGQGFNMTIRDIKEIDNLIKMKIENGLALDRSVGVDFEKNTKANNYLFSNGIDLIYEFFNLDSKLDYSPLSKSVKILGKNSLVNRFFKRFADRGLSL